MSFSVAVWGQLELPTKRLATTVAKHLARWVAAHVKETTVTVRGILDEDTFGAESAALVTAFRASAEHGGKGELVFVGLGADISSVVRVEDGSSSHRNVPERPEWGTTINALITESRRRFEKTPIGKAMRQAEEAAVAEGKTLRATTSTDDDAIETLFRALEPKGEFYNPMMEPSKSAMERLRAIDARVSARAMARLEASWKNSSVLIGAYCIHLISLIVHYRHREARRLLATIHAKKSARFDVRIVAARALLDLATDAEIRATFRASRETMVERWSKPNAKMSSALLKKLAK